LTILSRLEENQILAAIQTAKLDPYDFEWLSRMDRSEEHRRIVHKPTESYLDFSFWTDGGHWMTWRPTFPSGERSAAAENWNTATRVINLWVEIVRRNHEAPDLWGALRSQTAIPDAAARAGGHSLPFTPKELKLLDEALADVERYITTQPLGPDARQGVTSRFTYLKEAARAGVRKVDWLNIFVSQMVGMVVNGVVKPSFYGPVMAHAKTALNAVFQFGGQLLTSGG
jgi:hypothetical protein